MFVCLFASLWDENGYDGMDLNWLTQLKSDESIGFFSFNLNDLASINLNDSEWMEFAPLVPNRSHTEFVSKHTTSSRSLFALEGLNLSLEFLVHDILAIEILNF